MLQRIHSIDEFKSFRERIIREQDPTRKRLIISAGTCGQASGASDIIRAVKRHILENGYQDRISLRITGCQGLCQADPTIMVIPDGAFYAKVRMSDVPSIVDAAVDGNVLKDLLYRDPATDRPIHSHDLIPFYAKQTRIVLAGNDRVDPIRIYDYIGNNGYAALESALTKLDPDALITEIKASGLRGRGGAGFPTGVKWRAARDSKSRDGRKFVVCNCDEGDPGAYMDRALLEGNPHSVLEGLMIAGVSTGATHGVFYIRMEYPLAIKHTLIAIRQARELGLLGENILGTGVNFDVEIVRGAGAFVCGEETALMASIEGRMGEPRQRPPYPVEKGIWGCPTCINNVETLANVPVIISRGAKEYAKVGVPGNTGTKIFSLVGKVRNTGLVEVPMGISLGEIIYDIGGGPSGNAPIKAVQTGGPSGGCIPASMFDLKVDYDSLGKAGSIMGSGGMIVMDEHTCMVDIAKYYMRFLKDESCGKCYTCRKGTQRMYEILEDISEGRGTLEQIDLLEELALVVKDTTMCGLGQTASNPVLSTLKYFRHEYLRHILQKKCDAHVCTELVGAPCQDSCPIGTEAWRYVAHVAAGEFEEAYKVIRETNPFPSICARVCDHKCELNCRLGQTGNDPVAIRAIKRFVTDNVEPSVYQPERLPLLGSADFGRMPSSSPPVPGGELKGGLQKKSAETSGAGRPDLPSIPAAIIGAGPAGLTAAHYLSLRGIPSTVLEAEGKPGGMLYNCIPEYRLPHDTLDKEIASLLDDRIELKLNTQLGRDFTIDSLLNDGYKTVFLAIGAQKGKRLRLEGEDMPGVLASIEFLKSYNQEHKSLAKGRVGVIGGGNSAVDAARTALRQKGVTEVTILYRRTRDEMPAFKEEIEAALEEGIKLETLVTPVELLSGSLPPGSRGGSRGGKSKLTGIRCIRNELGEFDDSGRRKPVPLKGTEFDLALDTLIVAISEAPDEDSISPDTKRALEVSDWGTVKADPDTLECLRPGVFAGGDVVTGPNTVVDAIAAGKRAALMMERFLMGDTLRQPVHPVLPSKFVPPLKLDDREQAEVKRVRPPVLDAGMRCRSFAEVERTMKSQEAKLEARRCLRCDLEFTQRKIDATAPGRAVHGAMSRDKINSFAGEQAGK